MKVVHHIAFILQNLSILFAFITSLYVKRRLSIQMKLLRVYVSVAFIIMILACYGSYIETKNSWFLGIALPYSSIIIHFVLLSFILVKSVQEINKNRIPVLIFVFAFIITIGIFLTLFQNGKIELFNYANAVSSFGLIVLCLFYFFLIVKKEKSKLISDDFNFWIAIGVFISMGIEFPSALLTRFTLVHSSIVTNLLRAISSLAFGIQYIFFSKAFIWQIQKLKQ